VALPRPQIALEGVRGHIVRLPRSRQANGLAGGLLLVVGVALVALALMTVLWQDPVTAVFTQHEQKALSAKLEAAEKAPVPESTLSLVQGAESDPERIAVLAQDLVRRTPPGEPLGRIDIPRMGTIAQTMLRDSLDAYVKRDTDLARSVLNSDDELDGLKTQVFRELLTYMLQDVETIEPALDLILVSRHLERIGDHATNVAEDVIFMVSAQDVRHHPPS